MLIILPEWTVELEEKLDKVIKDLAIKYHIDLTMVGDSKGIKRGKDLISNTLVRIYENYGIEERKRLEEFEKDMKKDFVKKRRKTTSKRIRRSK